VGRQEDGALKKRRSSEVFIAVTLVIPIVLSSLSLFSHIGLSQSGSWTDFFDDEFKIAQKSNVVISGGDVSLGPSGMNWFRHGMVLDVGPIPSTYESSGWPSVVKGSDGIYRMWYTGAQSAVPVSNRYIRYATSVDGKNWDRMGIVIGPNATLEDRVYAATVIEDGGMYKMWYVGDERDSPWGSSIFYATSPDGYTWTRRGLVLPKAFEGTYDNVGVSFPAVLRDGGIYKMWYTGYDDIHYRILYATSPDGQSWTYQNLAIDVGSNPSDYDYMWAFEPAVVKDANGMYHIWYSGGNGTHFRILNATSPDGVTWTKQGLSLDVLPDSQEDVGVLSGTVIMLPGSVVTMWYEGVDSSGKVRIFRATLGGSGYVVSEAIGPHPGCDWGDFFANKTDPNADIFVSFSVLDAVDWTTIPGYWNLTDVQFSLLSVDPLVHPTIRLRADLWNLQGNFTLTPELHDWTITWTDPNPPPPDKTPPEILDVLLNGDSVLFIIEGAPSVILTATVDDSTTGGSIVGGANATSPAGVWWNSTPMNPVDIPDTSVEDFFLIIDTSLLSLGSYDICVYGWDVMPNYNETGACALLMVIPNPLPDIMVSSSGISFAFFPPAPREGQLIMTMVNTTNAGDVLAENFTLVIFEDTDGDRIPGVGENISIQHISGIGPLSFNISYAMWVSMMAGMQTICAFADSLDNVTESNETNNVGCRDIEVLPGGVLTTLVVGQPNHVSDHTFITSVTPLTLQVTDLAGEGVAYTEYRVDSGDWVLYADSFYLLDEGFHLLEYRSASKMGYLEPIRASIVAVDNTPPESEIHIGNPHYFSIVSWIRSTTPLSVTSDDPPLNQSITHQIDDISVYQENISDGEPFEEYLARSNHTVTRGIWPGLASVAFHIEGDGACPDIDLGVFLDVNDDGQRQVSELVDYDADADQIESVYIENPQAGSYIITIAGFTVTNPGGCLATLDIIQTFGGSSSSDIESSQYRLWNGGQWSEWLGYSTSFHATTEGLTYVEYYASDNLGNSETVHSLTVYVDDVPPHSTANLSYRTNGGYDALITFIDSGCGVSVSFYRTNNEPWQSAVLSQIGLTYIAPGNYTVEFYAIDNLGNVENVKSVVFEIADETPLPTVNWKPLVAMVFAIILTIVGLVISKRRPWKGDESKRAVLMSFIVFSMPFVLTEAMTGLLSLLTGLLSIPPVNGLGTLVDIIILAAGLLLVFARLLGVQPVDRTIESDSPDSAQ
jgi:predicted GH43/DUF377 family glycosyl hydrolase